MARNIHYICIYTSISCTVTLIVTCIHMLCTRYIIIFILHKHFYSTLNITYTFLFHFCDITSVFFIVTLCLSFYHLSHMSMAVYYIDLFSMLYMHFKIRHSSTSNVIFKILMLYLYIHCIGSIIIYYTITIT
jgi:hypothetical protein